MIGALLYDRHVPRHTKRPGSQTNKKLKNIIDNTLVTRTHNMALILGIRLVTENPIHVHSGISESENQTSNLLALPMSSVPSLPLLREL